LVGFTDAEGCFHAHFSKKNNGYSILFNIAQKGKGNKEFILDNLNVLFGVGKVSRHYYENN
jgi:LAGLIDADG endonuclease